MKEIQEMSEPERANEIGRLERRIEKIRTFRRLGSAIVTGVGILTVGALVGQAYVESNSKFNDLAIRIEAPRQVTRDVKHRFMHDHEVISGKVIAEEDPLEVTYEGTKLMFSHYRIQTESGKIYNTASRVDIFNIGDDITVLLGAHDDCECESSLRPIEAYQINNTLQV